MRKGKQERIAKNKSNQLRNLKLASGKANSVHPMIGKAPVLRYEASCSVFLWIRLSLRPQVSIFVCFFLFDAFH
jgi:hypothetical protein